MDHRRHILLSSYLPQQLQLDDPGGLSQIRQPLSDSAGNAQLHALASVGICHDNKALQPRVDRSLYSIPTVPSNPPRQALANTLELRRQSTRRRRHQRYNRNPIVDSPQYQAYRARQNREGNPEDAKWPEVLEIAFLDALLDLPAMGRRKYSYRGKPHGRNELIKEYLWIAYLQSLAPGQRPDESMQRTRKQVSSHIQVLKGFLRDHPAFDRLFPGNKGPKNGFEDSFKNDPTLRALSEGRLPNGRYDRYDPLNQMIMANQTPVRPVIFWLLIQSSEDDDDANGGYSGENVAHRYTGLTSLGPRESLETISNWRQRYPYLDRLQANGDLDCEIIHMDVSLNLMSEHAREGAHLVTRTELIIPAREGDQCHWQWQTITTVTKPTDLYRDTVTDPPLEAKTFLIEVLSASDAEIRVKLPFPAITWAHAFTCLTDLQMKYEKNRNNSSFTGNLNIPARSARGYVEQISMYQEIQSSSGPQMPFVRRAIILWTFQKARNGEEGATTWRYLDVAPQRRTCMSPSPHPSHHMSATMSENFNSWADVPMNLQHPSMLDPFVQGLATPPNAIELQSPFITSGYPYSNQHFDMPPENLSFAPTATLDSEPTLVGEDAHANIDSFLSNTNVNLSDYDHNSHAWQLPHGESFDSDPAWANYTIPSGTPHIGWDSDAKNHPWPEAQDPKNTPWIEDTITKHQWTESASSPLKQIKDYVEQNVEQKLLPWINHVEEEVKATYVEAGEIHRPDADAETSDAKQEWTGSDADFDYNQLAEHLK